MKQQTTRRAKPEEEELDRKRAELSELETDLADRELYLTTLHLELSTFERTYARIVGTRYAELDEVDAEIAELIANVSPSSLRAQDAATQARSKARESREVVENSLAIASVEISPSNRQSLRSLYRELAKRIHPDLATDPADRLRRQQLMADANKAYEEGDEDRLRAILEEYEASPESVKGEGAAAELVRVIRKISQVKRRLAQIDEEAAALTKSELFALKAKVDRATKDGRNLLEEIAQDLDSQIAMSRERLNTMVQDRVKNGRR